MARPISVIEVTPEEKRELERRVGALTTPARDCIRAHIVLLRSEGVGQQDVASRLGVSAPSVTKWSQRFDQEGLDGLKDKPGRGAKPSIPLATVRRVVEEAGKAPPGRQRWSTRSLAREVGISPHSVARIWRSQGLKPHRLRTFKVSTDKKFEEKFWDVVGLYLDPPASQARPRRRAQPRPRPVGGVPSPEPRRVRERDSRPARPGDRCDGTASGRRCELRVRQHRGLPQDVADARAPPRGGGCARGRRDVSRKWATAERSDADQHLCTAPSGARRAIGARLRRGILQRRDALGSLPGAPHRDGAVPAQRARRHRESPAHLHVPADRAGGSTSLGGRR